MENFRVNLDIMDMVTGTDRDLGFLVDVVAGKVAGVRMIEPDVKEVVSRDIRIVTGFRPD
jgi:hypothetical protein